LTDDELDDLVDEWHEMSYDVYEMRGKPSLQDWICEWTYWSSEEYLHWVITGEQPE